MNTDPTESTGPAAPALQPIAPDADATYPVDMSAPPPGWEELPGPPLVALPGAPGAATPSGSRHWRVWPRSLTGRLVTGVVSLVVVLVVATGAATYFSLRSFLYQRLDQQLSPVARTNARVIAECLNEGASLCGGIGGGGRGFQAPQTAWVAVVDSTGQPVARLVYASPVVRGMQLSQRQGISLVNSGGGSRTLQTADGQGLLVNVQILTGPDGTFAVVTGLSTDDLQRTLHEVLVAEFLIGAGAVLLAFLATNYGVRFSLRPLYRVTRTARDVAAELSPEGAGLDRRVPAGEPDTEVGQLAESMNTLLAAVEEQFAARVASEQRMRQFLADASHELRTPLTSIRGYAELARMQQASGADTDYPGSLRRIESEGTRMSRLVDDLLTLARNDHPGQDGGAQREPVDVADLVHDAVEGARAAYSDRPITVMSAAGLTVDGDRDALLRMVRNLVTNAAVHTRPGGPIAATATRDGDGVLVQVRDSGPGLSPDEAAHVFERFWRADKARSRASGGSGLGLAIVASIVAAHGGTVSFASSVETGSTVSVWLPIAAPPPIAVS